MAREFCFNTALLGSPAVAARIKAHLIDTHRNADGTLDPDANKVITTIAGNELVVTSLLLGLPMGFITNVLDQLKTVIQAGKFKNMREAWAAQVKEHDGSRSRALQGLFGRAAVYRALYIAHAVVAFNYAREKLERWFESR